MSRMKLYFFTGVLSLSLSTLAQSPAVRLFFRCSYRFLFPIVYGIMATSLWLVAGKPSFGAQPLPRFPRGGGFPFPFYNTSLYRPTGCCSKAFSRGAAPPALSARRRLPFPVLQRLNL